MTNSTYWLSQILQKWEDLFEDVEYQDIPLEYVQRMVLHFKNGEKIDLRIKELVEQNDLDYVELERQLDSGLERMEQQVKFVDWHLDSKKAADVVQDATDKILGDIK